jgi:hypothetical protein
LARTAKKAMMRADRVGAMGTGSTEELFIGNRLSNRGVARLPWSNAVPIAIMVGCFTWLIGTLAGLTAQHGMFWSMDIAGTSAVGAFFFWAIYRFATGRDDGLGFFVTVVLSPAIRFHRDPGAVGFLAIQAAYCCVMLICCFTITRFRPEWSDDLILDPRPEDLRKNDSTVSGGTE